MARTTCRQEWRCPGLRRIDEAAAACKARTPIQSGRDERGEALRISSRFELPWYDSLVVASALEAQCDLLYSEDFQHGQQFGNLRISNPYPLTEKQPVRMDTLKYPILTNKHSCASVPHVGANHPLPCTASPVTEPIPAITLRENC